MARALSPPRRIVIVGGGVIGLACAWELARAGVRVCVLDAAIEAREASWAAAGMLAPHHEYDDTPADAPRWRLGRASLERWPDFARALSSDSADDRLDFRCVGGLLPLLDGDDPALLTRKESFLLRHGITCERLRGAALQHVEPSLAPAVIEALRLPAGQVDPRRLTQVLREACGELGVELRFGVTVTALEPGSVQLRDGGCIAADMTVLASGAWTPQLAALAGIDLPGEPVKGQMVRLAANDGLLRHFVHSHHAYLVARQGQGVVVGSTMTSSGFDKSEDAQAIAALAAGARRLLPALADAAIAETWTGLRPRLHHGAPLIARVRPDLIIASGHFRNGILLTPITAAAVAALVLDHPLPPEVAALPSLPLSATKPTSASTSHHSQTTNPIATMPTVLVVDDDLISRRLLTLVLTKSGYATHEADSGTAAWAMLERERFGLVLLDVTLPGIDGYEVLRRLRTHADAARAATPVIAMTGHADDGPRLRAAGASGFLPKPFAKGDVLRAVASCLPPG